jgi:toxin ParE1/3/4
MIVVLTETAIADLVAIGRHIKADNPKRAETFVAELEFRCHQLGTMPKAFALVPRHEDSGVRRRPYRTA